LITPLQPFEENGPEALANVAVGTGPYRFVEWVKDDHVLLEANPDYWGGVPLVQQLEFRPVPEPSSRVSALLAGEAQIVEALPLPGVDQLNGTDAAEVRSVREATRIYWGQWNAMGNEYLQDLKVRQALNYAVDKQAIIDSILGGHAEQNASCVTFESFGYADVPEYEYNPELASQLLAEAGYPNGGFTITLDAALGRSTGDAEIVQAIISYLGEVGVTVELQQQDFANYLAMLREEQIQALTFGGKTIPALDADYMFAELQPEKLFGWLFPLQDEAQELYLEERSEMDEERRAELAAQIQQWFRDQAGALFLWQADLLYGVSSTLNWEPRGDGLILGVEMSGA
jgi:peptide/nickel transport system substrate-binding protein